MLTAVLVVYGLVVVVVFVALIVMVVNLVRELLGR